MGRRKPTSQIIDNLLMFVGLAGVAGLTIAAPNSLVALEKPIDKLLSGAEKRRQSRQIARYLKQQKLVSARPNDDGSYTVTLTEAGQSRSRRASLEEIEIPKGNWDKKWRIIMFDIPETHKTIRDYISRHLRLIGFKQLQRSVFIFPYPIDEFVAVLREEFPEISKYIIYLTADDLDAHNSLVKSFSSIL